MSLNSLLRDSASAAWSSIRNGVARRLGKKPVDDPNLLLDPGDVPPPPRPLLERLKDTYRLTIMNPETFEEVGSYNLSLMSVYTAVSTMFVFFALLVVSLIVFTPVKQYIPGYGDSKNYFALLNKVDDLEDEVKANQTYTDYFRKMLTEDVETKKEAPKEDVNQMADSLLDVPTVEEERQLREQYERNKGVASIINNNGTTPATPSSLNAREVALEQLYFTPPLDGQIIRGLKAGENHFGIDLVAPKNTPIKAAMDGYVISADFTVETGNTIVVQHRHGVMTTYKHCSSLLKKQGSFVRGGEAIAIIGNTGTLTSGPHLHFELWQNGKCVDPTEYISFNE
jgi:murein DD-endopeptidase MepM/ murein hydrolase activator NlpD